MGKFSNFMIGAAVGAAAGFAVKYLFGPAPETTFDAQYQSRLDHAIEEGRTAAQQREIELRTELAAKQGRSAPQLPPP